MVGTIVEMFMWMEKVKFKFRSKVYKLGEDYLTKYNVLNNMYISLN